MTSEKFLDKFVKLDEKQESGAKNWAAYYDTKYPVCGRLDNWDEDAEQWPELTDEEKEELSKSCCIM